MIKPHKITPSLFKRILDQIPYRISDSEKQTLVSNVNYPRLNDLLWNFYSPYMVITLGINQIQVGDQMPLSLLHRKHGLLTAIWVYNQRIDILLTKEEEES